MKIQSEIFRMLIILVSAMTFLVASVSIFVNVKSENKYLDQNLQNMAQTITQSQIVQKELAMNNLEKSSSVLYAYIASLKESLANIDVISIVGTDNTRICHTTASLIGTVYDGSMPIFEGRNFYVTDDTGPSGSQRRAYAAVYDEDGNYLGFILVVILNQNINKIIWNTVRIHLFCVTTVVFFTIIISKHFSKRIKDKLLGYEPDTFRAMFRIRDSVLESLEEGIIAVGLDEEIIYLNQSARDMLHIQQQSLDNCKIGEICPYLSLKHTLEKGKKYFHISIHPSRCDEILVDQIPVMQENKVMGALCILKDRSEYTKLMEDLTGVRYMVESMRANNHDFINKLHVILGLIQMGNTKEASEYITHITAIQQNVLHNIIKNIEDPMVAALLIGKYARAAELNIQFTLEKGSNYSRNDVSFPSGDLVTIIGNLLDNAMDSLNEKTDHLKELSIGIFTKPHSLLINVDDTGNGIDEETKKNIYNNGFSTKGENRGTGLYLVKSILDKYNGTIVLETEYEIGTSFIVTLTDGGDEHV